ncbi:DUF6538 domain-containing protein [Nitrincola sp.]|uniref:DUF6538 domain-containing protein n=1 Tax=Nitrincola sp. TaxID=1926584 RepID=UPI003A8CF9DF
MKVKYLVRKASGLYYYRRDIPKDLRDVFKKREIKQSLKTHDQQQAVRKAQQLTKRYDLEFERMRGSGERDQAVRFLAKYDLIDAPISRQPSQPTQEQINNAHPLDQFLWGYDIMMLDLEQQSDDGYDDRWNPIYKPLHPHQQRALDILNDEERVSLTEVRDQALKLAQNQKKVNEINRTYAYFIDRLTVLDLAEIRTRDAQTVVDKLLAEGLKTETVKKALGIVRKGVRTLIKRYDMTIKNPFDDVELANVRSDTIKRHTASMSELKEIHAAVVAKKHLVTAQIVGLLLNTGCRCNELGGLMLEDIVLTEAVPHIRLRHAKNRQLKNDNSERRVPLTGVSLEVAKQIVANASKGQVYAFERYNKDDTYKRDNCSNAVNKWLRAIIPECTSHSFRHALRDRLVEASIPELEIDNILGWASNKMIQHYGKSEALATLRNALERMHKHEDSQGYSF